MEVFTGSCLFGLFTVDVKFSRVINFARKSLLRGYFRCMLLESTFKRNRLLCGEWA